MRKTLLVLFCWGVLSTSAAQADPVLFGAFLTGEAEGPSTPSPGLGIALVSFDAAEQQMGVLAAFEGLLSPSTVGHIHCCVAPPGTAAPATTVPTFPGFPTGVTSGFYAQSFDLTDPASFNPAFLMAAGGTPLAASMMFAQGLAAGQAYFNVHSEEFPGGEIRGFFQAVASPNPIPEPSSFLLLGGGLLAAAGVRRWRRKA